MKIYLCDRCGKREEFRNGIVGNKFDYNRKFATLTPAFRTKGIVDVCRACFKVAVKANAAGSQTVQEAGQEAAKAALAKLEGEK